MNKKSFFKHLAWILAVLLIILCSVYFFKDKATEAQTTLTIYAQGDFNNGALGGFATLGGTTGTCNFNGVAGQCSNGIWIENNRLKINYLRNSTTASGDVNKGIKIQFTDPNIFRQRLYVAGDWEFAPVQYENLNRKIIYVNPSLANHWVVSIWDRDLRFYGVDCDGSAAAPKGIYTFPYSNFWGKLHRIEVDMTASSGIGVADAKADFYLDGTLIKTISGFCTHTTATGWNTIQIGQQTNTTDKTLLYDELRYLDNVIVANYKSGATYTPPPPPTNPAPVVAFSASPTSIVSGGSSTLTWNSTNATSCTASGGWTGTKAISGSQAVAPTANTVYTISCTGLGGTVSSNTTVTVSAATPLPPPPTTGTLNEPAGMTKFFSMNGTTRDFGPAWSSQPKWLDNKYTEVVSDATNPTGSGKALEKRWYAGEAGNNGGGLTTLSSFSSIGGFPARELYLRYRVKWSPNFDTDITRSGMKLGYWGAAGRPSNVSPTQYFVSHEPSMKIMFRDQTGSGSAFSVFSPGAVFRNDVWHTIEVYQVAQSAIGVADGVIKMWVDGVLVGNNTSANFIQPVDGFSSTYFDGIQVFFIRAEQTATFVLNDYMRLGELYISGKAGTSTPVPPPPPTGDLTAPSTPQNLTASAISSTQINLSWSPSTDNVGVTGYKIYRNGVQTNTSVGTSFQNINLSPSTTYTYTVAATDAAGNTSAQSTARSATTLSAPVTTTPTVSLVASPQSIVKGSSATLSWSSTNTASCSAPWTSSTAVSGTAVVLPAQTTTYSVTCKRDTQTVSANATITVTQPETPLPPTNAAPVLSNVKVASLNSSSATITWNTDITSDSQVKYSEDISYTSASNINLTQTTVHSMKLSKLRANTTYHYKAVSRSATGLSSESSDQTFTTPAKAGKPINLKAFVAMVWGAVMELLEAVF